MGAYLHQELGRAYLAVGLVFSQGSFRAVDPARGELPPHDVRVGVPGCDDVTVPFLAAGPAIQAVDLRGAPLGVVSDWLSAVHRMRETGAFFSSEKAMTVSVQLARRFQAIVFVARTTPARGL